MPQEATSRTAAKEHVPYPIGWLRVLLEPKQEAERERSRGYRSDVIFEVTSVIGGSDCESIGAGFLSQPANALSSSAYILFGILVILRMARFEARERQARIGFGVLLIATGLGSILFHGPQGPASKFLHDVSFLTTILFVAVMTLGGLKEWTNRRTWLVFGIAAVGVVALVGLWPTGTNVIAGGAVALLVVTDMLARRAGALHTRWFAVAVVAMIFALFTFTVGRSGSPLCSPDSLIQGHALWHVLSASALWAYFEAVMPVRTINAESDR